MPTAYLTRVSARWPACPWSSNALFGPKNAVPKANTVSDANGANESDLGVARFLAVAALEASECALLMVMENVSLNPAWVGIVESIENPEFTSGQ